MILKRFKNAAETSPITQKHEIWDALHILCFKFRPKILLKLIKFSLFGHKTDLCSFTWTTTFNISSSELKKMIKWPVWTITLSHIPALSNDVISLESSHLFRLLFQEFPQIGASVFDQRNDSSQEKILIHLCQKHEISSTPRPFFPPTLSVLLWPQKAPIQPVGSDTLVPSELSPVPGIDLRSVICLDLKAGRGRSSFFIRSRWEWKPAGWNVVKTFGGGRVTRLPGALSSSFSFLSWKSEFVTLRGENWTPPQTP